MFSARGGAAALAEAHRLCGRAVEEAATEGAGSRASAAAALGIVLLRSGDTAAAYAKLAETEQLCSGSPQAPHLRVLLEQHEADV